MKSRTVRFSKTFDAPLQFVYDWWTDYSEEDMQIVGSKKRRTVVLKTKEKAIYISSYSDEDGTPRVGVAIVTLQPSKKIWHLDYYGEDTDEVADYRLERLGKNKAKLSIIYKEITKMGNPSTKQELVQFIDGYWTPFAKALEKEYNQKKIRG
jgi:hypothetical protein